MEIHSIDLFRNDWNSRFAPVGCGSPLISKVLSRLFILPNKSLKAPIINSTDAGGSNEFEKISMSSMNFTFGRPRSVDPSVMDLMDKDVCSASFCRRRAVVVSSFD